MFTVLPFGLSSAPFIFTNVVRPLVRYWRSHAVRITVYLISFPLERIISAAQVINSIRSRYPFSAARKLAQFVGKIISMGFVFGNITRIVTRYSILIFCVAILGMAKMSLSGTTLVELCFWRQNTLY